MNCHERIKELEKERKQLQTIISYDLQPVVHRLKGLVEMKNMMSVREAEEIDIDSLIEDSVMKVNQQFLILRDLANKREHDKYDNIDDQL